MEPRPTSQDRRGRPFWKWPPIRGSIGCCCAPGQNEAPNGHETIGHREKNGDSSKKNVDLIQYILGVSSNSN